MFLLDDVIMNYANMDDLFVGSFDNWTTSGKKASANTEACTVW